MTERQNYIVKNGVRQRFPIPEAARPTLTEMREVLSGYDQLGVLLPNSAILTDDNSKVDILKCGILQADVIEGLVAEVWDDAAPTTVTVGGILSGTSLSGESSIDILERILYAFQPAGIATFITTVATTLNLNETLSGSRTFTFSLSNPASASSLAITFIGTNGIASGTVVSGLANTATNYTFTLPIGLVSTTPGTSLTYRLTATQTNGQYASVSTDRVTRWWSRMYWGKSDNTSLTNFSGLTVGSGSNIQIQTTGSTSTSVSLTAGSGYVYFFVHNSRSITAISQGPLPVLASFNNGTPVATPTIDGIPYKVYRSDEILNGSIDFTVTTA